MGCCLCEGQRGVACRVRGCRVVLGAGTSGESMDLAGRVAAGGGEA